MMVAASSLVGFARRWPRGRCNHDPRVVAATEEVARHFTNPRCSDLGDPALYSNRSIALALVHHNSKVLVNAEKTIELKPD
ncbi:Os06g0730701 [Oryza sativa Japonica Group]|uniref:Uncharacterized protein n=2 Tax=Oryza sativa subsp. japonica TaxID=39947 RepID=Q5Z598_ORYSJ|nr:hypothetical protein [Oryza sativa Japonica Group]BAD62484.1 hypothetical protein [Oryza sativa Japonica Group]BAS99648.1 Os06g0730701 [Oryza sativa Japonica Group]